MLTVSQVGTITQAHAQIDIDDAIAMGVSDTLAMV
jgi:hypothetical protein